MQKQKPRIDRRDNLHNLHDCKGVVMRPASQCSVLEDSPPSQETGFQLCRCVAMLADLYHAPARGVEESVGTSTLGSSEAIMLAGLAMKKRWQARMESQNKPTNKPNLIMGYNVQVSVLRAKTNQMHANGNK